MYDFIKRVYRFLFNEHRKEQVEQIFLFLALVGFIVHVIVVYLIDFGLVQIVPGDDSLFTNVISAIYTPFSFILVYEVLLLVYYLPYSFSTSIAKQYEITSLIILRRIFKDIAKLDIKSEDWSDIYHLNLVVDMAGVLIIVLMIYAFYRLLKNRPKLPEPQNLKRFVLIKKGIAVALVPVLILMSTYSLLSWLLEIRDFNLGLISEIGDINAVFYDNFFNLLILVDVMLLMISLFFTTHYSLLIRNAGFVVSTILIRLSFSFDGWQNTFLILLGVGFGIIIQALYNLIGKEKSFVPREFE
ncbi:MAG: hypothetical protein MRZ79_03170 [Bacteroidia bacterium]|nr:hypothetical protein [Bacteroidia bacterium]